MAVVFVAVVGLLLGAFLVRYYYENATLRRKVQELEKTIEDMMLRMKEEKGGGEDSLQVVMKTVVTKTLELVLSGEREEKRNEVLPLEGDTRGKVTLLVGEGGLSQSEAARRLGISRERVRQICDEIFGKGVAVERNRVSHARKGVMQRIEHILQRENAPFLLWAAEEAMRNDLEVALILNPRGDYNVLFVNNHRVNVQVAIRPNVNITTTPLYHWALHRDYHHILLALHEGFVRYSVILPANGHKGSAYLPLDDRFQRSRENTYVWRYVGRWDLLTRESDEQWFSL